MNNKDLIKTFENVLDNRDNSDKSRTAISTALKNIIEYLYQDKVNYLKYKGLNTAINNLQDILSVQYDEKRSYLNEMSLFEYEVVRYELNDSGEEIEDPAHQTTVNFLPDEAPKDILKWLDLKCSIDNGTTWKTNWDYMTLRLGSKISFELNPSDEIVNVNSYISASSSNFLNFATFKSPGYWEHTYKSVKKDTDDPLPVSADSLKSWYPSTLNGYIYTSIEKKLLTKYDREEREQHKAEKSGTLALNEDTDAKHTFLLLTLLLNGLQSSLTVESYTAISDGDNIISGLSFQDEYIGVIEKVLPTSEYYLVRKNSTTYEYVSMGATSWSAANAPTILDGDEFKLHYSLPVYTEVGAAFENPFNQFYKTKLESLNFIEYANLPSYYQSREPSAETNWLALKNTSTGKFEISFNTLSAVRSTQPNFMSYTQIDSVLGYIKSQEKDKLSDNIDGSGMYKKRFELLYLRLHKTDGLYAKAVAAEIGKYSMTSMNNFSEDSDSISKQYETAVKLFDYRVDNKKDTFLLEMLDYEKYLDPSLPPEVPKFVAGNKFYLIYTDISMTKKIKEFSFSDLIINTNIVYDTHVMDMNYKEKTYIDGIMVPNMRPAKCYSLKLLENTEEIAQDEDAIFGILVPESSSSIVVPPNPWA